MLNYLIKQGAKESVGFIARIEKYTKGLQGKVVQNIFVILDNVSSWSVKKYNLRPFSKFIHTHTKNAKFKE